MVRLVAIEQAPPWTPDQPNVNAYPAAPESLNSISNRRSVTGIG
jgi:hypothetical protein